MKNNKKAYTAMLNPYKCWLAFRPIIENITPPEPEPEQNSIDDDKIERKETEDDD